MKARPTQSRKGVKGGLRPFSSAPCRVKGQRPLWGLGQRPNCSAGDQFKGRSQQKRRQRSVPASNFALPQERPQAALSATCTLSRQMGATDQHREKSFLGAGRFCCREISPLRRRPEGFAVALWTPSHAYPCYLDFIENAISGCAVPPSSHPSPLCVPK